MSAKLKYDKQKESENLKVYCQIWYARAVRAKWAELSTFKKKLKYNY